MVFPTHEDSAGKRNLDASTRRGIATTTNMESSVRRGLATTTNRYSGGGYGKF